VHLGTRLSQSDPFTDEYNSTYSVPFGEMINQRFVHNNHAINAQLVSFHKQHEVKSMNETVCFSSEVLYIKPHPGLNYHYFDFSKLRPKAVLHDLYHSGTACIRTSDSFASSFIDFLTYCRIHDVPVYIAPLKNQFGDLYTSSIQFIEAGAIPLGNISTETALVKLMLAFGCYKEHGEILDFMLESCLFFEFHKSI
jgi:L-asparaginase